MADMGLFGLPFPEEYGGMGGDYFALCLALEELGKVDQSVAITLEAGVSLGAMPVYRFGNEAQKQEWLPLLGKWQGARGIRPDRGRRRHRRGRHQDHRQAGRRDWVINGNKQFITNSGTDITKLVTVTAVTGRSRRQEGDLHDPGAGPHRGIHRRARLQQGGLERLGHPPAELRRRPRARKKTCWASGAAGTPTSCASSMRAGSPSQRCPSARPRAAWTNA